MDEEPTQPKLVRSLTYLDGISLIVGIVMGTGIFATPGVILSTVQHPGLALVVWILGGILAMFGGLCFSELGTAMPTTGGGKIIN